MSIGSIGNTQDPQASWTAQRPDPAQLAQKLFSQLDTSGQGYLDTSDLQSAMDKVSLSAQGQAMSASDLMAKMDTNGDGKVTESEFANALQSAAQQVGGHHGGHHHHHAHGASGSNSSSQGADGGGDQSSQGAPSGSRESASSDPGSDTARIMGRIMQLMQAYNPPGAASTGSSTSSTVGAA